MEQGWPTLNQDIFDALHPFSFITDEQGLVTLAGRSFTAMHRDKVVGRRFCELGVSTLSAPGIEVNYSSQLLGEIFRFRLVANPDIILRGHVVRVPEAEPAFIFSLLPSIVSIEQISHFGLSIADFEVGTPLIDWLMLLRTREIAQAQLGEANSRLRLDVRMSELLQRVTTDAFCAANTEQLYRDTIRAVCRELSWNIGHLFFIDPETQSSLISTDIWFLSEPQRYQRFVECTNHITWDKDQEFPWSAIHQPSPLWMSDWARDGAGARLGALPAGGRVSAVAIPIRVSGKTTAVIEFISEQQQIFSRSASVFFSMLGAQLGLALERQEAARKEREQLVQLAATSKMATLGELAAGLAHEIKNPLSTISLIVQILKRFAGGGSHNTEMQGEQLARIDLCVDRIASIVRKLNDFSRESSADPFTSVEIQQLLADALALTQARFAARGVQLDVRPCSAEWKIDCRPSQVSQILLNLLSNAFDAVVDAAERLVTLECHDRGDFFHFVVSDSGQGIPQDLRAKIMSPFFTTKPPGAGVGLGLSISSHIAATHGGSLRLDEASPGTRFVLELPKRQIESAAAA